MDELKELVLWFEKITGLRGVSLSIYMNKLDVMLKQKSDPFYWQSFNQYCKLKSLEFHGKDVWWKCNSLKHLYSATSTPSCLFTYCPLCPPK